MLRDYLIGGALLCAVVATAFYGSQAGIEAQSQGQRRAGETGHNANRHLNSADRLAAIVEKLPAPAQKPEAKPAAGNHDDHSAPHWALVYVTWALVGVTAALAFYTAKLWGATNRLVRDTSETGRRQLRAYVNVSLREGVHPTNEEGKLATAVVYMFNAGQTPAFDVVIAANLDILPYPAPNPFPICEADPSYAKMVLHPRVPNVWNTGVTSDRIFPASDFDAKERGEKRLYLYGEVRYRDIFDKPHFTRFRLMGSPNFQGEEAFAFCPEGNETDD